MTIPGLNAIDPKIKKFLDEKKYGVILYDLFPDSDITAFHRIKLHKKKSNGIILIGNENQLEFLSRIIYDKLLSVERRDGFWGGIIEDGNKLVLIYSFYKDQEVDYVVDLLGFKFRYDLINICEMMLSELSFIQVKINGIIVDSRKLDLEDVKNASTTLPTINKTGIIYH